MTSRKANASGKKRCRAAAMRITEDRPLFCQPWGHPKAVFSSSPNFPPHVSDINWNVELRKIEREFTGQPPERTRTQIRLQKIQEIAAKDRFLEQLALVGLWAQVALVAVLALSLFWWPYGRSCGFPLVAFLLSNVTVIVGGVALCLRAWRERMPWIFGTAAACMVLAWTVIALHALPRFGYSPAGGTSAGWSCSAPARK
jgi:hypothetical protein